jgi:serine protease Do
VTFASGRSMIVDAANVSADKLTDLAILRLPASLPDYAVAAEFADSDKDVQVGDWVLAAGSPLGLKQTITAGIISAKGRVELGILDYVELLQTDAAINPGSSGGPLFDQLGRVVGINVAIASTKGLNKGIAFVIPSNSAREIFDELVKNGEVIRGYLGIGMQELPQDLEHRLGVSDTGGVIVAQVENGSPADLAGMQKGDVILRYDHEPVGAANPLSQLRQRIARTPPDSPITIDILRRHRYLSVEVTVAKRKPMKS